ncbi:FtsX-like permease family protein [Palleronia sp.]|uniref:ABC transporter permease n=1 Tax=Palleronia sp. TaxID=1940284 RepID=UPI0035C7BAE4
MGATLGALLSHWWRRPFQLVTLMVGLATATALWSGVQAINAEARASYDRAATTLAAGTRPRLVTDGPIPQETFVALRRAGHDVSPVLEDRAQGLRIIGIDPFTLPPADLPQGTGAQSIGPDFIAEPGQLLVAPGTDLPEGFPPAVETPGIPGGTAYTDIGTAQRILDRSGELSALIIAGEPSLVAPPLSELVPNLRRTDGAGGDVSRLTESFHLNLTAFGFLSFAVGLFIVRGAIGLAFEQRRGVFRTLRALGLPRRTLLALLSAELLILSLVAGAIGIALGYLVASLLIPDVAATLRGLYGAEVAGTLSLRPSWWLSGFVIATLGTAVAAAASLWRTAQMPLLAPANPRAWSRVSAQALRLQTGGAAAFWIVAGVAWAAFDGLAAGFVLLGALLLGAALTLPLILRAVLRGAARTARGPRAEWFWADSVQQLPGLSLALMALLLALAANIGVGTMVSSFRLTFTGWLDQRLAAELNVRAATEEQAEDIAAFLAPRVDAVLPIRSTDTPLAGAPGELTGVADHPTYSKTWPLIARQPDTWEQVSAGEAALVNEQLARRNDLWPGDAITIAGHEIPIAGVYSDYGNPRGQAMVGLNRFERLFPEVPTLNLALRLDPARVDEVADDLRDRFDLPPGSLNDQASIKRASIEVFERTFTVTGALNVLTLGVAGLAILTSLLTIANMRLPQLAPVWALGFTRRRLAVLDLGRAVMLAALTFLLSLPVGLVLAWVLLSVINVEAFGWRLSLHLFPLDWVRLFVLSLLAAVLAALLPARKLSRTPPSELLKVFAHER